jgi:hypothetical protein
MKNGFVVPARHGGNLVAAEGEEEEPSRSDEFSKGSHQVTLQGWPLAGFRLLRCEGLGIV